MSTGGSAAASSLPSAGDVLAGKYTIVRVIGEGGMGVVYEARHAKLGNRVAIKVLREAERKVEEFVARFEREARAAARLKSRNVTRVHDVDLLADGTPFMVMEFLDGLDLDTELGERGRLPYPEAVGYMLQACSGVAEAHAVGIIHRDLKPHNLFLCGDESERVVKLLDFGISKMSEEGESSVTLTRSSLGTPLYMSPEQIRSAKKADARADIWSLGVILYEVVTGKPPFDGEGPSGVIAAITADDPTPPIEIRPELPKALSDAILKALEKNPAERFSTVNDFAEAIQPFGPAGAWTPPPTASSPSHSRVSYHDLHRISADAITEPAREIEIQDLPISEVIDLTPAAEPKRRKTAVVLALLALIMAGATIVFFATAPRHVEPAAAAPPAEPAQAEPAHEPTTPPPVATPAEPQVSPTVAATPSPTPTADPVPAPKATHAQKAVKPLIKSGAASKKEEPAAAPTPPPPTTRPAENPLHL